MKTILFIGPPGCGKTTQVERLTNIIHSKHYVIKATHFIEVKEEIKYLLTNDEILLLENLKPQTKKERISGKFASIMYDELLFETTKRVPENTTIYYEGGPRGIEAAQLFLKQEHLLDNCLVFHFHFPKNEEEYSISRQVYRGLLKWDFETVKNEMNRFKQKYTMYRDETLEGLELLKNQGITVHQINALDDVDEITSRMKETILT